MSDPCEYNLTTSYRADAPLTPAKAMRCPEVAALVAALQRSQAYLEGMSPTYMAGGVKNIDQRAANDAALAPFTKGSDG